MITTLKTKEMAWTLKVGVKSPANPNFKELIRGNEKALRGAILAIHRWQVEDANRPKPPTMAELKPLVKVFGYDPFIGDVYRGIRTNKAVKLGNVTFSPSHAVSSWTTDPKIATKFASRDYMLSINRNRSANMAHGYVLRLRSDGLQLMSVRYAVVCGKHLLKVLPKDTKLANAIRDLESQNRREDEIIMRLPGKIKVEVVKEVK